MHGNEKFQAAAGGSKDEENQLVPIELAKAVLVLMCQVRNLQGRDEAPWEDLVPLCDALSDWGRQKDKVRKELLCQESGACVMRICSRGDAIALQDATPIMSKSSLAVMRKCQVDLKRALASCMKFCGGHPQGKGKLWYEDLEKTEDQALIAPFRGLHATDSRMRVRIGVVVGSLFETRIQRT
eukprot:3510153-Lingulodinium_polyedra.AAC.1